MPGTVLLFFFFSLVKLRKMDTNRVSEDFDPTALTPPPPPRVGVPDIGLSLETTLFFTQSCLCSVLGGLRSLSLETRGGSADTAVTR